MSQYKKIFLRAAGAVFAAALGGLAHGQVFPEREISLTVNYGAGGNTDVVAREYEDVLRKGYVVMGQAIKAANLPRMTP